MPDILKNESVKILKSGSIDLLIESYSSVAAILQIRGMAEDQSIAADIVTTTARALQTTVIDIASVPIFLTARTAARAVKRGQLYVKISLRVDGLVVALLAAGYVSETHKIAYPGGDFEGSTEGPGLIRSITGTNPAAGAEILETVPTGARWRLKAMIFSLVTDATVVNRLVVLEIDDGTSTFISTDASAVQPASQTVPYSFFEGSTRLANVGVNKHLVGPLTLLLLAGYRIRTATSGLQAGDNWGAPQLLVEEWIEP